MIKNIRHIGIVVENIELSRFFYENLLGFKEVKKAKENSKFIDKILAVENSNLTTVKLVGLDNQLIELLYFENDYVVTERRINEIGPTHIAFTVEKIDLIYKNLIAEGVKFLSNPQISPDKYAKVAFCIAPEGTFIELVEVL